MPVTVVQGDLTDQQVDAVVNAANEQLAGGSGVCGRIFQRAGWRQMSDACAELGGCPTGEARTTPGFGLLARWVIHAVGPVWRGGGQREEALLAAAYRNAEAGRVGATAIPHRVFPLLSTGVYGYPLQAGCRVAWDTLRQAEAAETAVTDIRLVAYDDATREALERVTAG